MKRELAVPSGLKTRPWVASPRAGTRPKPLVLSRRPVDDRLFWSVPMALGFIVIHLPLALLMRNYSLLAAIHAWVTLACGVLLACRPRHVPVAQWVIYAVGAEVLWRMCRAPIPWEFAKYAISLVCLISLLRTRQVPRQWLPAAFFGLLLPASVITFGTLPWATARQDVSFYLSGPLCLAVCGLWFSTVQLRPGEVQRLCVTFLAPVAGMAFVALFRMATTTDLDFSSTASNSATSGGYGPNQVSAILGLGALFAVFLVEVEKRSTLLRAASALLVLWLLGQAAMTFSRTGVYLFVGAFVPAAFFLIRWKGRGRWLALLVVVAAVAAFTVFPVLNTFTGGKLSQRFQDMRLTGRDSIARGDLKIWRDHPLLGAGVGMAAYYRTLAGDPGAAHTEYTRLIADHGVLGMCALVLLLAMVGVAFWKSRGVWAKGLVVALVCWALLFMLGSAMRLAAPAFLLGLVQAKFWLGARYRRVVLVRPPVAATSALA